MVHWYEDKLIGNITYGTFLLLVMGVMFGISLTIAILLEIGVL